MGKPASPNHLQLIREILRPHFVSCGFYPEKSEYVWAGDYKIRLAIQKLMPTPGHFGLCWNVNVEGEEGLLCYTRFDGLGKTPRGDIFTGRDRVEDMARILFAGFRLQIVPQIAAFGYPAGLALQQEEPLDLHPVARDLGMCASGVSWDGTVQEADYELDWFFTNRFYQSPLRPQWQTVEFGQIRVEEQGFELERLPTSNPLDAQGLASLGNYSPIAPLILMDSPRSFAWDQIVDADLLAPNKFRFTAECGTPLQETLVLTTSVAVIVFERWLGARATFIRRGGISEVPEGSKKEGHWWADVSSPHTRRRFVTSFV
jgi:hypothetical protein